MTVVNPVGVLFAEPQLKPLSPYGLIQPSCYLVFLQAKSSGPIELPMTVYQDGYLTTPFASNVITSDNNGRFPPIYLNPASLLGALRVQLFNVYGQKLMDVDPYVPQPSKFIGYAVKPVATSAPDGNVMTIDPALQFYLPGPGIYEWEALVEVTTTGASGPNPGFSFLPEFSGAFLDHAASCWMYMGGMDGAVFNSPPTEAMNVGGNGPATGGRIDFSLTGGSALNQLSARGCFSAMSPGTLAIYWAQQTSNATSTTMSAGSYFKVRQLQ
jgi:hypothetical protein